MNYKDIEVFLELVRCRNITKAAENLYLSQSAVSNRLKSLEDELGVQLNECADETVRAISNSDAFKAMPNYPADGCIQTIDGVVTLKVADFPF